MDNLGLCNGRIFMAMVTTLAGMVYLMLRYNEIQHVHSECCSVALDAAKTIIAAVYYNKSNMLTGPRRKDSVEFGVGWKHRKRTFPRWLDFHLDHQIRQDRDAG